MSRDSSAKAAGLANGKGTKTGLDRDRISELLRELTAREEKIVRLYFGLGCQRPHSAQELAEEFGISLQSVAGILEVADKKLAEKGLTSELLRERARSESAMAIAHRSQRPCRCRTPENR